MAHITWKDYMVADVVEHSWFIQYPWSMKVVVVRGTECLTKFAEMIQKDFGATKKSLPTENCKLIQ